jgi:hypothetical protein
LQETGAITTASPARQSGLCADIPRGAERAANKHLHRYLSEFDFRYSNRVALGVDDLARAEKTLRGSKRLTYRSPSFSPVRPLRIGHGGIRASKQKRKPKE